MAKTISATNENFRLALRYIGAERARQKPPKLPDGLTQSDISNAEYMVSLWPLILPPKPMAFYGKVVDENGRPVAGVVAHFQWDNPSTNINALKFRKWPQISVDVSTDDNGRFSLENKPGIQLDVSVGKEGYYSSGTNRGATYFRYSQPNIDTFYGRSDYYKPDSNSPVVYYLRKKGIGANALVTSQFGIREDYSPQVPLDGTPVKVDLLHRKVGEGPLELFQVKPEYAMWKTATNWSLTMRINDGGFIEHEDEFAFNAPQSGYQPVANFDFQKGQTNWTEFIRKRYYIKFGTPPVYGQLEMETSIERSGVTLYWVINPDGSRNLEPKQGYFPSSSRWTH